MNISWRFYECIMVLWKQVRTHRVRLYLPLALGCLHVLFFSYVQGSELPNLAADKPLYVWEREGIPLYETPSTEAIPLGRLEFGECVWPLGESEQTAVDATLYCRDLETYYVDDYLSEWTHPAKWLKVATATQKGYVLDTYLLPLRPPEVDPNKAFLPEEYLESLSPMINKVDSGMTEKFCSQTAVEYENGIEYVLTDFGPCEQCGHMQSTIRIPGLGLRGGVVLVTEFFRHYGMFSSEFIVLVKDDEEGLVMEGIGEHGHTYIVRIEANRDGLLLIEDLYL